MNRPQRLARRQETRSAAYYGGRVVPQSGSGDIVAKADVETDTELIECKHTERKSYSLKLAEFVAHKTRAILAGRRAVWEVEYTRPDGRDATYLVVLERDAYRSLTDALERGMDAYEAALRELEELKTEVEQQAKVLAKGWLENR